MKRCFIGTFLFIPVWILTVQGFAQGQENRLSQPGRHNDDTEVILRLHGSNTIGSAFAPALAEAYLKSIGATDIERKRHEDVEMTVEGKMKGKGRSSVIEIHAHGSSTAFKDLGAGSCDIGCASRRVQDQEVKTLSKLGDLYSPACEHVVAIDGIAVIVNKSNNVFRLGKSDIKKIFSGQVTDWSQIGGASGKINVYSRNDDSGTWDTFKHVVLESATLVKGAKRIEDSEQLSREVANDPNGIGFIGLPYILNAKAVAVSDGSNPVFPEKFSVSTEDYPLSRRLYLYTPSSPSSGHVKPFVEFALSTRGQDIAEATGFVGLGIKTLKPTLSGDFSPEYVGTVKHMERLSCNFRFKSGSFDLDNRSLRDLDRVVEFARERENKGRNLLLLGFADNIGDEGLNRDLSERRAQAVRKALNRKGVNISRLNTKGYGQANPIAANDTAAGRDRNRRVEVWLR